MLVLVTRPSDEAGQREFFFWIILVKGQLDVVTRLDQVLPVDDVDSPLTKTCFLVRRVSTCGFIAAFLAVLFDGHRRQVFGGDGNSKFHVFIVAKLAHLEMLRWKEESRSAISLKKS